MTQAAAGNGKPKAITRIGDKLLAWAENPPPGMHWRCAGPCGQQYVSVPPADSWCPGCKQLRDRLPHRSQALLECGVPGRCRDAFVEPGTDGAYQAAWPVDEETGRSIATWDPREQWCLFLRGPGGVGKSMFAAELLWRQLQARHRLWGRWVRASEIADQVLSGNPGFAAELADGKLVVVDEVGVGHSAEAAWSAVENVICRRWENRAPTIFTTNLAAKVLHARSAPMVDRLRDGMCSRMTGASHRGPRQGAQP